MTVLESRVRRRRRDGGRDGPHRRHGRLAGAVRADRVLAPALDRPRRRDCRPPARTIRRGRSGSRRTTRSWRTSREKARFYRGARRRGGGAVVRRARARRAEPAAGPRRRAARSGRSRRLSGQRRALAARPGACARGAVLRDGRRGDPRRRAARRDAAGARSTPGAVVNAAGAAAPLLTPGLPIAAAQGPPRHHRPPSRFLPPPARRARIPQERPHAVARVGRLQPAAARDGPDAARLLARVRGLRRRASTGGSATA